MIKLFFRGPLARDVGLRKSTRAMKVFFNWLGVKRKIPSYQAVRGWMQRLGLDRMQSANPKPDRIWIVDQSTQIGTDKFLTVLAVEQPKLPPVGTPLRRTDMDVLAVQPAKKWNKTNVGKLYKRLAEKYGYPIAVVTDGAVELRYPAENLEKNGVKPRVIRDLKHFLANRFEHLLNADPHYQAFVKDLNQTRPSIQQTELGHLCPPKMKQKARFMNMQPLLKWAEMTLWQLRNPDSDGRKGVSEERLKTKLGWLRKYRQDVDRWTNFQEVVSAANGTAGWYQRPYVTQRRQVPAWLTRGVWSIMQGVLAGVYWLAAPRDQVAARPFHLHWFAGPTRSIQQSMSCLPAANYSPAIAESS